MPNINSVMSENETNRSLERMRDHVELITSRYEEVCQDMADLGEDVHDSGLGPAL